MSFASSPLLPRDPVIPPAPGTPLPPPNPTFQLFSTEPAVPRDSPILEYIARFLRYDDVRSFMTVETIRNVCKQAQAVLRDEPNVLDLKCEEGKVSEEWVLVGDIHGQFNDLVYHVFGQQRNAIATGAPDKKFLFLGDYVDRGPQGLEVILLLMCLKVAYKNNVYFLRGNHEEAMTCRTYGFFYECRTKFSDSSIWNQCVEVFGDIPLAAVITCGTKKVFCIHGGLSPGLAMIEGILFIPRSEYGDIMDDTSSEIVDGLLWSDPSAIRGFLHNDRGCGFAFGENTSEEFCTRNGVDFICRAHQMVLPGYQWTHNDRVVTVFSAPNYCGLSNNKGAILILNGLWERRFVQYDPAPPPGSSGSPDLGRLPDYFQNAQPPLTQPSGLE